jgi:membrane-associated protein
MLEIFDIPYIISTYGYLGIFIIVFLESGIFFPLPGDSLLFVAGLFAGAFSLNIFFLIPMIFVATFLGSIAGYKIGKHIVKLQKYSVFRKILKQDHIDKAHEFFNKHGKMAVIFCRFVPIVRTFVPIVAGVAEMHYSSFIKYNLIGAALWSTFMTLLGFFLGSIFPGIKDYLWVVLVLVVLVSVLPIVWEVMRKQKKSS